MSPDDGVGGGCHKQGGGRPGSVNNTNIPTGNRTATVGAHDDLVQTMW